MSDFRNRVFVKSCEQMSELPDHSIDALVTDPPAGISFMGKEWDGAKGGRDKWIAWLSAIMREALRVMKPGAHGLVWALPRTSHWTATALEDAGFEVRDVVMHLFGSGFPKSLNVSKAIDAMAGAERTVIGEHATTEFGINKTRVEHGHRPTVSKMSGKITAPATEAAKRWDGWGTSLKPAAEHWILIRKPISEKNVAANVLKYGTGAIDINGSRIGEAGGTSRDGKADTPNDAGWSNMRGHKVQEIAAGRWPSHLVLSHNPDCEQIGTRKVKASAPPSGPSTEERGAAGTGVYGDFGPRKDSAPNYGDENGDENVPVYRCSAGCSVSELDQQSGLSETKRIENPSDCGGNTWGGTFQTNRGPRGHSDMGGASRFFWVAKPASSEKNANIGDALPEVVTDVVARHQYRAGTAEMRRPDGAKMARGRNSHPTVKPVDLMSYLIRMITPPGGIVLDCFAGSGTTLIAAEAMGFGWVGYEMNEEYAAIALARLSQRSLFNAGESA